MFNCELQVLYNVILPNEDIVPHSHKQLSKSIKIVLSSGFHIPFMFSQITIVTSLAANGSVHDFALSIPVPALPSLFHMEYSAAAHNNFNLASPLCSPRPSSEILVKAVTTANSLTEKPWSLWWYRNLPVWAIVSLVDQRLVASLMGGVWMSCTYFPGTRQFSF